MAKTRKPITSVEELFDSCCEENPLADDGIRYYPPEGNDSDTREAIQLLLALLFMAFGAVTMLVLFVRWLWGLL